MKKSIFIILSLIVSTITYSQNRTLPSIDVTKLDGTSINIQKINNNGNPIVISFWALWCGPCKKELRNIAEVYEDWQDETGVKIIAISIDNSRTKAKVAPFVNSEDWDYEVYLDPNEELKRAMGVSGIPHTFLLNGKNEIVWQHKAYVDGDEDILFQEIKKLAK